MYTVRLWSVRRARQLEAVYEIFEWFIVKLHPLWNAIGYPHLEKPIASLERWIKGFLFDCQMCGQCILSATGMSCPMNCPKTLRNGPCGGVRPGGYCEVKPEMRCVWVEAWEGSLRMRNGNKIKIVQQPVNVQFKDSSSWLRIAREKSQPAQQQIQS